MRNHIVIQNSQFYSKQSQTCWGGLFLAYMSPSVAPGIMFEWSLTHILDCGSDCYTAHATILKSCKYFWILWKTLMSFYFEQSQSMNIAIPIYHFRVVEIHFYIENPCQFSNSVNRDHKLESHSKQNKLLCWHFDLNVSWWMGLYFLEDWQLASNEPIDSF